MGVETMSSQEWRERAAAHATRLAPYVEPHLARRRDGVRHPVHDFLFTYYSQRPAQLLRWHPGFGVRLADAREYDGLKGYDVGPGVSRLAALAPQPPDPGTATGSRRASRKLAPQPPDPAGATVSGAYVASQRPLIESTHRLLAATAARPAHTGCFGMHEWAMVYRADETRHPQPLRLGAAGTDAVVESHRIACSHFDAFRFFTDEARPRNTLRPGRDDRADFEQPGCLHAGMDLYKHAFRLSPMVGSDLVTDCFELAWDIRVLDMRAAPYDLSGVVLDPTGEEWTPVRVETPEGRREYAAAQRRFAERGAPLRRRIVAECERLLG